MILQYLNSTKEKSIHYKGNKKKKYKTRKSTTGYIFLNGNSPISWKSQLQN